MPKSSDRIFLPRRKFIITTGVTAIGSLAFKGFATQASASTRLAQAASNNEAALYAAAKKEGKLVYYKELNH